MSLEQSLLDNENSELEFDYAGKHYTLSAFASTYSIGLEEALKVVEVLEAQGKITYGTEEQIADKAVRNALKEAGIFGTAQAIEEDRENEINYKKQQSRIGRHVYEKVCFDFGSMSDAKDFCISVSNCRLEHEITVDPEENCYIVTVFDLSDKELTTLSNIYKANKAVKATVNTTTKAFDSALKVTDYTAKKVLVPVTKIGLSGALSIGKSLLGTCAKIGGLAVSETVKVTRETASQIKDDENIAVAKAELYRTKNDIQHNLNKRRGGGGNGITIG